MKGPRYEYACRTDVRIEALSDTLDEMANAGWRLHSFTSDQSPWRFHAIFERPEPQDEVQSESSDLQKLAKDVNRLIAAALVAVAETGAGRPLMPSARMELAAAQRQASTTLMKVGFHG